eukprot:scaffold4882_cov70-Phaeocystis_antarctica.AAC.15
MFLRNCASACSDGHRLASTTEPGGTTSWCTEPHRDDAGGQRLINLFGHPAGLSGIFADQHEGVAAHADLLVFKPVPLARVEYRVGSGNVSHATPVGGVRQPCRLQTAQDLLSVGHVGFGVGMAMAKPYGEQGNALAPLSRLELKLRTLERMRRQERCGTVLGERHGEVVPFALETVDCAWPVGGVGGLVFGGQEQQRIRRALGAGRWSRHEGIARRLEPQPPATPPVPYTIIWHTVSTFQRKYRQPTSRLLDARAKGDVVPPPRTSPAMCHSFGGAPLASGGTDILCTTARLSLFPDTVTGGWEQVAALMRSGLILRLAAPVTSCCNALRLALGLRDTDNWAGCALVSLLPSCSAQAGGEDAEAEAAKFCPRERGGHEVLRKLGAVYLSKVVASMDLGIALSDRRTAT